MPAFAFPIAFLLILYGLFFLLYVLYSFFTIYHLLRFGVYGAHLYLIVVGYILVSLVIVIASALALSGYDWTIPLSPSDLLHSSPRSLFDL